MVSAQTIETDRRNLHNRIKTLLDDNTLLNNLVDSAVPGGDLNTIAGNLLSVKTKPKFKCSNYRSCINFVDANTSNPGKGDQYGKAQLYHAYEKEIAKAVAGVPKWVGFEYIPGEWINSNLGDPAKGGLANGTRKFNAKNVDLGGERQRLIEVGDGGDSTKGSDYKRDVTGIYRPCTSKKSFRQHVSAEYKHQGVPYVCMKNGYQIDVDDFNDYLDKQQETIKLIEENIDRIIRTVVYYGYEKENQVQPAAARMIHLAEQLVNTNRSFIIGVFFQKIIDLMFRFGARWNGATKSALGLDLFTGSDKLKHNFIDTHNVSVLGKSLALNSADNTIENMFKIKKAFYKIFAVNSLANGISNLTNQNDENYYYKNYSGKVSVPKPIVDLSDFNDIMNKIDLAFGDETANGTPLDDVGRFSKWKYWPDMSKHLTLFSDHSFRDVWEIFNDVPVYKNLTNFANARVEPYGVLPDLLLRGSAAAERKATELQRAIDAVSAVADTSALAAQVTELNLAVASYSGSTSAALSALRDGIARIIVKTGLGQNVSAADILAISGAADSASLNKISTAMKIPTLTENPFLHKLLKTKTLTFGRVTGGRAGVEPSFVHEEVGTPGSTSQRMYNMNIPLPDEWLGQSSASGGGVVVSPFGGSSGGSFPNVSVINVNSLSQQGTEMNTNTNTLTFKLYIPPGERGERGERGLQGQRGERGLQGQRGERGLPGADGSPGANGADGVTPTFDSAVTLQLVNSASLQSATLTETATGSNKYKLDLKLYVPSSGGGGGSDGTSYAAVGHTHGYDTIPSSLQTTINKFTSSNILDTLTTGLSSVTAGVPSSVNKYITKTALNTELINMLPTSLKSRFDTARNDISNIKTRLASLEASSSSGGGGGGSGTTTSVSGMTPAQQTAFSNLQTAVNRIDGYFAIAGGYLSQLKLNDLRDDITTNTGNITTNTGNITTLETSVNTNTSELSTLRDDLDDLQGRNISISEITGLSAKLSQIETDLTTGLSGSINTVALLDYAKKSELASYVKTSDLNTMLNDYLKITDAEGTYSTKTSMYIVGAVIFFISFLFIILFKFI